jgi:hypothetical protein
MPSEGYSASSPKTTLIAVRYELDKLGIFPPDEGPLASDVMAMLLHLSLDVLFVNHSAPASLLTDEKSMVLPAMPNDSVQASTHAPASCSDVLEFPAIVLYRYAIVGPVDQWWYFRRAGDFLLARTGQSVPGIWDLSTENGTALEPRKKVVHGGLIATISPEPATTPSSHSGTDVLARQTGLADCAFTICPAFLTSRAVPSNMSDGYILYRSHAMPSWF